MCLQTGLTIAFIMIGGGFRSLINFAVVASWAFYFLTVRTVCACRNCVRCSEQHAQVLGLVILRVKEPTLPRPYKTWIITPLVFCAVRAPPSSSLLTYTELSAGLSVPPMHAHHRCAAGSYGGSRCVSGPSLYPTPDARLSRAI